MTAPGRPSQLRKAPPPKPLWPTILLASAVTAPAAVFGASMVDAPKTPPTKPAVVEAKSPEPPAKDREAEKPNDEAFTPDVSVAVVPAPPAPLPIKPALTGEIGKGPVVPVVVTEPEAAPPAKKAKPPTDDSSSGSTAEAGGTQAATPAANPAPAAGGQGAPPVAAPAPTAAPVAGVGTGAGLRSVRLERWASTPKASPLVAKAIDSINEKAEGAFQADVQSLLDKGYVPFTVTTGVLPPTDGLDGEVSEVWFHRAPSGAPPSVVADPPAKAPTTAPATDAKKAPPKKRARGFIADFFSRFKLKL